MGFHRISMEETVKFTTARRLIKESKNGKAHPEALIQEAHATCKAQHELVARGNAAEAEMVMYIKDEQARLNESGKAHLKIIPYGVTPEQFARQQIKKGRQKRLDQKKVDIKRGKIVPSVDLDKDMKPVEGSPTRHDTMGNAHIRGEDLHAVVPNKIVVS